MSNIIEIKELLDLYEKEGLINNKLKIRKNNIQDYRRNIHITKSDGIDGSDDHLTYERGGEVLSQKLAKHKYWLKNLYLANKILIHILVFVVIFIMFFKIVNK